MTHRMGRLTKRNRTKYRRRAYASAMLLARLGGVVRQAEPTGETLLSDTRAGIRAVIGDRITRTMMCTSGAVVMVAGTMNVAELVLAQR